MPFVEQFRFVRIEKRSAKLRGRPTWQQVVPQTAAGRTAYAIAAKHEKNFSKAFLAAMKELLPSKPSVEFVQAWESRSVNTLINALPMLSENSDEGAAVWEKFQARLAGAYGGVIQEAGEDAAQTLNKQLKTSIGFSIEPIAKAAKKAVLTVAVNPYAVKWIEEKSLSLIKEGIRPSQLELVREIIDNGFSKGLRAEELFGFIKENIGLTKRNYRAVENRRALYEANGMSKKRVKELTDIYREQKLEERASMIARTETIAAQAEGRAETWTLAQEQGQLPPVIRTWIAAPNSCPLCAEDLDGKQAEIGGTYVADSGEEFDGPPAHPNCGCTETLTRVEE